MPRLQISSANVAATVPLAIGLIAVSRWTFGPESFAQHFFGFVELGIVAPTLLILSGLACIRLGAMQLAKTSPRSRQASPFTRLAVDAVAAVVMTVALMMLFEHVTGMVLGIDFHARGVVATPLNPAPGRMSPNACLGFVAVAVALSCLVRPGRGWTQATSGAAIAVVAMIGGAGLLGRVLNIEELYRISGANRLTVQVATSFLALSLSFWLTRDRQTEESSWATKERQIGMRAVAVLTFLVVASGAGGFAVVRSSYEKAQEDHLALTADVNSEAIDYALRMAQWIDVTASNRPSVTETLAKLNKDPKDTGAREFLLKVNQSFLTAGLSAMRLEAANGAVVSAGVFEVRGEEPSIELALPYAGSRLVAANEMVMQTRLPVIDHGTQVGTLLSEQRLTFIDQLVKKIRSGSETTDVLICGRAGSDASCLPSRFYQHGVLVPLLDASGAPSRLLARAVLGQKGVGTNTDLNGARVSAAYGPIGHTGLGFIVKTNVETLYGELRMRLVELACLLALFVILGTWAVRSQLRPLVAQLAREQRRSTDILEHSNDAFVALDQNGRVISWNGQAVRTFGWSVADAMGRKLSELIIPEPARDAHECGMAHFTKTGEGAVVNRRIEVAAQHEDGRLIPVELTIAATKSGDHFTSTAFLRDISERKEAEAALKRGEERLRAITDNLLCLIAYVDRQEVYRFANAHYQRLMNADPAMMVGRTLREFLGDTAYEEVKPHIEATFRGERQHFERTGLAGHSEVHFLTDYVPDIRPDGSVAGFFVLVLDITSRRRTEVALAAAERRVRQITDNLPAMISHFDRDLRYTFANAKVGEAFECDSRSLIGRSIREVRGETIFENVKPSMSRALAGETVVLHTSSPGMTSDQYFEANYIPELNEAGVVQGFYALTFDVTERRRAEDQLRRSLDLQDRTGRLASVGGWELDLQQGKLRVTEEVRRIHEIDESAELTVEMSMACYGTISAQPSIKEVVQTATETGQSWDITLPFTSLKGRALYVRATGQAEVVDGKAVRLIGAFQDVTLQVLRERQVQEQAALLQVTLRSIGDGVITADEAGRIRWMNPVAERMTGWSVDDARGKSLPQVFNVVDGETRTPVADPVALCIRSASAEGLPHRSVLISRDGHEYAVEDSASPIVDDQLRLLGAVLVFHDVSEQRRMSDQMTHRATHDSLTGLLNRAAFEARLDRVLDKVREDQAIGTLMYIDLDQFKLVNDACGHAMGDKLLCQVSAIMGKTIRGRDTLARLGGDEFGIVLENCSVDQAQRVAQSICDQMDEYRFIHDGRKFRIGTSIGLVPIDGRWRDREALQHAADASCYAAKEAGRNRAHVWYDTDQTMRLRDSEAAWVTRLESALDEDAFELFVQRLEPLTSVETAFHGEVLLRLRERDGKLVSPGQFLPAAERFHMATRIDRWVVKRLFNWLAAHPDEANLVGILSINLSGQSVGDRAFHNFLLSELQGAHFDASKLCMEITETSAITNLGDATIFIEAIRSMGIKVALDDFGAGASSFGYLKSLPVDYLKIDGQFVRTLETDALNQAAVRCFVDVAKTIGVRTVAEFVETSGAEAILRSLGVDFAQGFLFHVPEPLEQVLQSLRTAA